MLWRILLILSILFVIDLYVFQAVKMVMQNRTIITQRVITWTYWSLTAFALTIIMLGYLIDWHDWNRALRTYSFAIIIITYFSKIFVLLFLLIEDISRLLRWTGTSVNRAFFSSTPNNETVRISRLKFFSQVGLIVAAIPFVSLIAGMFRGAYNYEVRKVKLKFPNLPSSFDGLKILQISDLHTGSFIDTHHVQRAVNIMLKQNADLIFFTGDLVNDRAVETDGFGDVYRQLQAPLGVFSILGNHDYGDYYTWQSWEAKAANLERVKSLHGEYGWKILLNEHTYIEKNGEKIGLIGVENWSAHRNFSKHGDMKRATQGMENTPFKILLSHDPSHWNAEITNDYKDVDLTLSGHTHGFQFGVEIPGFKWSPVQYFYKQWADLYREGDQYLYVNRGLGFIGYPGRVGIMPEITVIELLKG